MNIISRSLHRLSVPVVSLLLALSWPATQAEVLEIGFDDLAPYATVPHEYPPGSGVTFALRNSPSSLPRPTTIPFVSSSGDPLSAFGAEGNLLTAGAPTPVPVYEVEISFDSPIDYFAVTALDNEEGFTVVGYLDGSVVASITNGIYLGWYEHGGWYRGPVHRAELGTIGGAVVFDQIALTKVGGDMAERFDRIVINFRELFVDIDIKPKTSRNCENLDGKGVIPVAIFGGDLDVLDIAPETLTLEGMVVRVNQKDQISASPKYVNDDEFVDLMVAFEDDGSLEGYAGLVTLRGLTNDGQRIAGSDYLYDVPVCPK